MSTGRHTASEFATCPESQTFPQNSGCYFLSEPAGNVRILLLQQSAAPEESGEAFAVRRATNAHQRLTADLVELGRGRGNAEVLG